MTDDSEAERIGFRSVWPESELLLCRFHICQAVWRWLTKGENYIPHYKRSQFYQDFNKILTSGNSRVATENYNRAKEQGKGYNQWISYIDSHWSRKHEWCLAFRSEKTRGHQTNNFAEITVRLLKDKTFNRLKAYNEVEIIDKICQDTEKYYKDRLKNFANGRDDRAKLQFEKERKKAEYLRPEDVIAMDDDLFLVVSENDKNQLYTVDPTSGFCSCPVGKLGSYCKHMAGVFRFHNDADFLNLPPITPQSKYEMAILAFGEADGEASLYYPLQLNVPENPVQHISTPEESSAIPEENSSINLENEREKDSWRQSKQLLLQVLEQQLDALGCSENVIISFITCIGCTFFKYFFASYIHNYIMDFQF